MSSPQQKPIGADDGPAIPRRLCFIVEDEPGIRHFLSMAAAGCGVEAETFAGAKEALAAKRVPDVVFLDLSLGESDAVEMLRELARRNYGGKVQLMSGQYRTLLDHARRVGENFALDMLPVLAKPFSVAAVRRIFALLETAPLSAPRNEPEPPAVDLGDALRQAKIEFWYQPKIDLLSGAVAGFEALARLDHPQRGILGPSAFIPNADVAALRSLTESALHAALRSSDEFADFGFFEPIAINVPVTSLLSLDIAEIVRSHRPKAALRPQIILEVTEDQVVHDLSSVLEVSTRVRLYGVALSIDDFGHAYSSLARLKALPASELKIDRSFVDGCASDRQNAVLCQAIVDLGHRFDCGVCAEGIEKEADLAALRQMGCDHGQGYLFDRPMPKTEVMTRLRNRFLKPQGSTSAA